MGDRRFEPPMSQWLETHERNVAVRVEGMPGYRLMLDPDFSGSIIYIMRGLDLEVKPMLLNYPLAEILELEGGTIMVFLGGRELSRHENLVASYAHRCQVFEAYGVAGVRRNRIP